MAVFYVQAQQNRNPQHTRLLYTGRDQEEAQNQAKVWREKYRGLGLLEGENAWTIRILRRAR